MCIIAHLLPGCQVEHMFYYAYMPIRGMHAQHVKGLGIPGPTASV